MAYQRQFSLISNSIHRVFVASKAALFAAICFAITGCGGPVGFGFEYTSISVTYPGIDIYYQAYGGPGSEEHAKWITLSNFQEDVPWKAKLKFEDDGGELELVGLDASTAETWANKQIAPRINRNDQNRIVSIDVMTDIHLKFDADEKLTEVRVVGWQVVPPPTVTFTTDRGSVTWPCDREKLKAVLGEPTKTEIKEQFDRGFR